MVGNRNPKIIVSLEPKKSIDLAHRIVDYIDGFKINHLRWDEIIAWPEAWAKYLSRNYTYDQIGDLYIERAEPLPGFPRTLKNQ